MTEDEKDAKIDQLETNVASLQDEVEDLNIRLEVAYDQLDTAIDERDQCVTNDDFRSDLLKFLEFEAVTRDSTKLATRRSVFDEVIAKIESL